MTDIIDLRCPRNPRTLFSKITIGMEVPVVLENFIEVSCSECAREQRRQGFSVARVLHRYDFSGTLIESEQVRGNPSL